MNPQNNILEIPSNILEEKIRQAYQKIAYTHFKNACFTTSEFQKLVENHHIPNHGSNHIIKLTQQQQMYQSIKNFIDGQISSLDQIKPENKSDSQSQETNVPQIQKKNIWKKHNLQK